MVPSRSKDNSIGGAFGEMMILGVSVTKSIDLGVAITVDLERGVYRVLETICRAWVVPLGVSPAFYLFAALVGVFMINSRLKLCVPIDGAN
ncbi:UNVERIFIED_CONTAM: hypothetical protein Sradi_1316900 [Sesamum radiatum]|uniref:Uncharacterized protein n=1 Tax=Sesamum radiatum TaxID=300843 RepID=A0AAW2UNW7_SESRA